MNHFAVVPFVLFFIERLTALHSAVNRILIYSDCDKADG